MTPEERYEQLHEVHVKRVNMSTYVHLASGWNDKRHPLDVDDVATNVFVDVTCPSCKALLPPVFHDAGPVVTEQPTTVHIGGNRYNKDKPRFALVSPFALKGLAAVLTFGAKKYAAWNWTKGLSWLETVDSLQRHLQAFLGGEDIDPESTLPHIDHVLCNAMFLAHFYVTKTGTDDRWRKP